MDGKISISEDNTYTLNSLRKVLGCNRLTAEKYIAKGNYKKTSKSYNNNDYDAWIIPESEIERLRNNLHYTQQGSNVISKTQLIKDVKINNDVTAMQPNTTLEMLRNIKELNGRITTLENDNRQLQQEIKTLTNDNIVLEREKTNAESKVLLIEDKQRYIEGKNAEQGQEITNLKSEIKTITEFKEKSIKQKNTIIIILSALLLIIATVSITIMLMR